MKFLPSFALIQFGCRANQSDGTALAASLRRRGWELAEEPGADYVVVNTCTVTAAADAEARRTIRRLARLQPPSAKPRIVVTGCYAQRAPAEVGALPGVAAVVDHARQAELPVLLGSGLPKLVSATRLEPPPASSSGFHTGAASDIVAAGHASGRTRATVKVQDGCGRSCSFCVIPMVRGASRSLPLGEVLAEVQALAESGCQEAVISGINLGQWGRDLDHDLRLPALVQSLLEQTTLPRLRLSSVEPMDWSDELIRLMAAYSSKRQVRLARHAHLPLQSGSDAVLRRMHRRYRAEQYAERVRALRRAVPLAAIGADVMVGFPGETDAEFDQTRKLIAALPLTYLHVFTFSARQGTEAGRRLAQGDWKPVPAAAAERAKELRRLIETKRRAFLTSLVGQRLPVLTLRSGGALSDNFCEIDVMEEAAVEANQLWTLEVTSLVGARLQGRRVAA